MTTTAPNIAFLSTAHIHSKGFLDNIATNNDGRKIHVIWDDVAERGRRYADTFKARFEPDLAKVLADAQIDGFAICAENTRHMPLLRQVVPIGKPVFCEKPILTTSAEAVTLAGLVATHRTPMICGYFKPFAGDLLAVRRMIEQGVFGKITRVRYRNAHHAAYGRWFDSADLAWFTQPALSGGGAMMDMGAHAVHLLRSLFGPVQKVLAVIANHSGMYPSTDDYGMAHIQFANGILGAVEAAWTQTGGIGGLEIVGSDACLWNTGNGYVTGAPGQPATPVTPVEAQPTTMDRLVALIRGQLSSADLAQDFAAVLDEVAIMEAAYTSAKSGTWAIVPGIRSAVAG